MVRRSDRDDTDVPTFGSPLLYLSLHVFVLDVSYGETSITEKAGTPRPPILSLKGLRPGRIVVSVSGRAFRLWPL